MGLLHGFMAKTGRAGAVSAGMAPPRKKYPLETRPKKTLELESSGAIRKTFFTCCGWKQGFFDRLQ